jgi:hypothetical protein
VRLCGKPSAAPSNSTRPTNAGTSLTKLAMQPDRKPLRRPTSCHQAARLR